MLGACCVHMHALQHAPPWCRMRYHMWLHAQRMSVTRPTCTTAAAWVAVRSREELEGQYICFERCTMAGKDFIVVHSTSPCAEEQHLAEEPADDSTAVSSSCSRPAAG
jgi:hypothetical protein